MATVLRTISDATAHEERQSQLRLGRLLAVVALMLMSGALGALGEIAWEEYSIHQPRVYGAVALPSGGSSISAHGNVARTTFSSAAKHDGKGLGIDVGTGPGESGAMAGEN
ncbi:MAG: hypothetical protein AB7V46_06785 [Thermomicrobiales bacterium]